LDILDGKSIDKLPKYSYIEPMFLNNVNEKIMANDMHPPHHVLKGEELILSIYKSIRGSKYWDDTLLIITFDENGGFYDHQKIIKNPFVNEEEIKNDKYFEYLGYRVPFIAVSKFLPHYVDDTLYEHSSIPGTLQMFLNGKDTLKSNRITKCNKLSRIFSNEKNSSEGALREHPDVNVIAKKLISVVAEDGNYKNYQYPYEGYSTFSLFGLKMANSAFISLDQASHTIEDSVYEVVLGLKHLFFSVHNDENSKSTVKIYTPNKATTISKEAIKVTHTHTKNISNDLFNNLVNFKNKK